MEEKTIMGDDDFAFAFAEMVGHSVASSELVLPWGKYKGKDLPPYSEIPSYYDYLLKSEYTKKAQRDVVIARMDAHYKQNPITLAQACDYALTTGKFKGKKLVDVYSFNKDYLKWVFDNVKVPTTDYYYIQKLF